MAETEMHVKGYGSEDVGRREDSVRGDCVSRSLAAAGIACLTLMVVALIAAISGGAREATSPRPSVRLQLLATKQLQILEQTEVRKGKVFSKVFSLPTVFWTTFKFFTMQLTLCGVQSDGKGGCTQVLAGQHLRFYYG